MEPVPLIVTGLCTPERKRYSAGLAAATRRGLIEIPGGHAAVGGSTPTRITPAAGDLGHVVVDVDVDVDVRHLDVVMGSPAPPIVCVIDARHLIDDLRDGSPLDPRAPAGDDRGDVGARARRAATLLEAAESVSIVQWESVDTPRLSLLMALASHLAPRARVRLSRGPADDVRALFAARTLPSTPDEVLERAGWVHALNDSHDPHMTDPRVTTFRYERLHPFHPARLASALDRIDAGRSGLLVRSAGFCRIASRPGILARWDQVGSAIWIDPLDAGPSADGTAQDIALTGLDLIVGDLVATLDSALVTDAELEEGPECWRRMPDPLPVWPPLPHERSPRER
ncbi:CobW C-terminal domain-containing protein [Microbacterium dextranolyticum]|uniref:CobW C-terminal domain-containing protein n=1 Tax=Microbacterium dextranolyticum TaxID=36806 RepID=A0A9W6M614_9MICO|nr:GTP-binding protein [Microbacterium dextranolyticum]MBM7464022.1 G3E family GTPase [Microbacterium dextranolyticum]GLJ95103.1 hypothetical protein GCM10017591_11650 [Microbacterium dextranolyticum]